MLDALYPTPDGADPPADLSLVPDLPAAPVPGDLLDGLLSDGEDTLSLVLDGAVDDRLGAELAEMLSSLRASHIRHIVLELATVTAMDGTGLQFLFAVQGLALERGGSIRLADAPDVVLDLVAANAGGAALRFAASGDAAEGWPGARPA
ncbi:MAG TPA: STAS domain-containing protein [Mycobacteriales bacterium]